MSDHVCHLAWKLPCKKETVIKFCSEGTNFKVGIQWGFQDSTPRYRRIHVQLLNLSVTLFRQQ